MENVFLVCKVCCAVLNSPQTLGFHRLTEMHKEAQKHRQLEDGVVVTRISNLYELKKRCDICNNFECSGHAGQQKKLKRSGPILRWGIAVRAIYPPWVNEKPEEPMGKKKGNRKKNKNKKNKKKSGAALFLQAEERRRANWKVCTTCLFKCYQEEQWAIHINSREHFTRMFFEKAIHEFCVYNDRDDQVANVRCEACDCSCRTGEELLHHIKRPSHDEKLKEFLKPFFAEIQFTFSGGYTCWVCKKTFRTEEQFHNHAVTSHRRRSLQYLLHRYVNLTVAKARATTTASNTIAANSQAPIKARKNAWSESDDDDNDDYVEEEEEEEEEDDDDDEEEEAEEARWERRTLRSSSRSCGGEPSWVRPPAAEAAVSDSDESSAVFLTDTDGSDEEGPADGLVENGPGPVADAFVDSDSAESEPFCINEEAPRTDVPVTSPRPAPVADGEGASQGAGGPGPDALVDSDSAESAPFCIDEEAPRTNVTATSLRPALVADGEGASYGAGGPRPDALVDSDSTKSAPGCIDEESPRTDVPATSPRPVPVANGEGPSYCPARDSDSSDASAVFLTDTDDSDDEEEPPEKQQRVEVA